MTTGFTTGRALRPTGKVLPEHARGHNRSLVLQTLYRGALLSRADIARETGLTRVTVSDLVSELLEDGLVVETGQREDARPGKPATMLAFNADSACVIGIDLSSHTTFRGAVLKLDGSIVARADVPLAGASGAQALAKVHELAAELVSLAKVPVLGIGVGSPGVVDLAGTILSAPNLDWEDVELRAELAAAHGVPVLVSNDANVAALAEHSFGGGTADMLLVTIGHGVGGGLLLGGMAIFGSRFASGEIGHVVVGTDGGAICACGKEACLETWLAVPRLESALASATTQAQRTGVLSAAGRRLGIALAPVVGVLDLSEIVLVGPSHLIDGPLAEATVATLRARTMAKFHSHIGLRMSALDDIVLRGAAVMVVSTQLGVS